MRFFANPKTGKPTIVAIDDFDALDQIIRQVFFNFFTKEDVGRLLLIMTLNEGTQATNQILSELGKSETFKGAKLTIMQLAPPQKEELFSSVRNEIAPSIPDEVLDYVYGLVGGDNPIVFREIIQFLSGWYGGTPLSTEGNGAPPSEITLESARERLGRGAGGDAAGVEGIFRRLYELAVERLPETFKLLLWAAAVAGECFPRDYLVRILACERSRNLGLEEFTESVDMTVSRFLSTTPLIETVDRYLARFKSSFLRRVVLSGAGPEIAERRRRFIGDYLAHLFSQSAAQRIDDVDRGVTFARILLQLDQADDGSGPAAPDGGDRLTAPTGDTSPLLIALEEVVAYSLMESATDAHDGGLNGRRDRVDEIIICAVDFWYFTGTQSSAEDDAVRNLWALHETLMKCDPKSDHALARAHAALLRLRIWLNLAEIHSGQRKRRVDFAKGEAKAARAAAVGRLGIVRSALELKAIEIDLQEAEAYIVDIKSTGRNKRRRRSLDSDRDIAKTGLGKIEAAISRLARPADAANELKRIKAELRRPDLDAQTTLALKERFFKLSMVDQQESDWPEALRDSVEVLRLRAMERLTNLAGWFSAEDMEGLDATRYTNQLIDELRNVIGRHVDQPRSQIHLWALRKLGLMLVAKSRLATAETDGFEDRQRALAFAEEAVERLSACHTHNPATKVAVDLVGAIERLAALCDYRDRLVELREILTMLARELPPDERRSYVLCEIARVDRFIQGKGDARWPDWLPSLWRRHRNGKADFMDACFTEFGQLSRANERTAAVDEMLEAPDLSDLNIPERLIAAVKRSRHKSQDPIIAVLERYGRREMNEGQLAKVGPAAIAKMERTIAAAESALGRASAEARLSVVSLRMRLRTRSALTVIAATDDVGIIEQELNGLRREFLPMRRLADALGDGGAQYLLVTLWTRIAEAMLDRAKTMSARRELYFFLRDSARDWFEEVEILLEDSFDLSRLISVWEAQADFHREFGNLFEASTYKNRIARARRYDRYGEKISGLLYRANGGSLNYKDRTAPRDTRFLLEAVLQVELNRADVTEVDRRRMRERLGVLLWQNVRLRQPRSIRDGIPLLPSTSALLDFTTSESGAGGLIGDIMALWAADPPEQVVPGTMLTTKIVGVTVGGLLVEDRIGRRYLVAKNFLPVPYFHFFTKASVDLNGNSLDEALRRDSLQSALVVVILGETEIQRYEKDFGALPEAPLVTARGKNFVETALPCLLPRVHKRLAVGASNSAVVIFMAQQDLSLFSLEDGILHKQITTDLLHLRRLVAIPLVATKKDQELQIDLRARLMHELVHFVRSFWSDLVLVDLREDLSEAVFELSIGTPVDPRMERTTRSMLIKAFPKIRKFSIIGGVADIPPVDPASAEDEAEPPRSHSRRRRTTAKESAS